MNTVYIKSFTPPPVDKGEVLRYMGVKTPDEQLLSLVDECINELEANLSFKVCFFETDVSFCDNSIDFCFCKTISESLKRNLYDCKKAVIFAATVGVGVDMLCTKYSKITPSKAVVFHALGTERVEALCDMFNDEIKLKATEQNLFTKPRFSPGYGDLSLEIQKDLFNVLSPQKIGITLNDNLMMSPSKSVTAIIGIGGEI